MRGQRLREKQGLCFRAHRGLGRQQPHRKRSSGGGRDCSKETEHSGMFVSRMVLNLTAINSFSLWPLLLPQGNNHKPQGGTSLLAVWGLDLNKPASLQLLVPGCPNQRSEEFMEPKKQTLQGLGDLKLDKGASSQESFQGGVSLSRGLYHARPEGSCCPVWPNK